MNYHKTNGRDITSHELDSRYYLREDSKSFRLSVSHSKISFGYN